MLQNLSRTIFLHAMGLMQADGPVEVRPRYHRRSHQRRPSFINTGRHIPRRPRPQMKPRNRRPSQHNLLTWYRFCAERAGTNSPLSKLQDFVEGRGAAAHYAARTGSAKRAKKLARRYRGYELVIRK